MRSDGFDPRVLKFCAWTGLVFAILWPVAAGAVTGGQYILPPSASDTAREVVADYSGHLTRVRIGATILIFSSIFYLTFGMAVSMLTKKREREYPVLFYIQLISLACCVVVIFFIGYFWGAASWRAGDTTPETTQALNDLGWLGVLYTGAPFAVYMLALAATTFLDDSDSPIYPRWSAYFNVFVSFFMFEASLILFWKTGPFSQNGIAVFWIPMIVFFSWIVVFTVLSLKAIKTEAAQPAPSPAPTPAKNGNGHGTDLSIESLAAELQEVRAELAQVSGRN